MIAFDILQNAPIAAFFRLLAICYAVIAILIFAFVTISGKHYAYRYLVVAPVVLQLISLVAVIIFS